MEWRVESEEWRVKSEPFAKLVAYVGEGFKRPPVHASGDQVEPRMRRQQSSLP